MWITYPPTHILLKASLSSTFLKTMGLWSRWSSKDKVQRRDTCPEPTELRQIGCSTESVWTPKIQIKYVDTKNQLAVMLTKGSFTRYERDHLFRLLNIMNFSVFSCSHFLWNRKHSVMSKRAQESTSKEGSAVPKKRPMNLELSRRIRVPRTARGIKNWTRVMFHPAAGNWRETATKTQQRILKRGNKTTLNLLATGKWCGVVNLQAQPAPGNWSEVRTFKSEGQRWNSTTCRSPTIDTLRKSSRTCGRVESRRRGTSNWYRSFEDQRIDVGTIYVDNDGKPPFILHQITLKFWKCTGTQRSRNSRICSTSRRDWYGTIKPMFWMYHRLSGHLPHGRATLSFDQVIQWTEAKVRVYSDSVVCLGKDERQQRFNDKMGRSSGRSQKVTFFSNNCRESMENQ